MRVYRAGVQGWHAARVCEVEVQGRCAELACKAGVQGLGTGLTTCTKTVLVGRFAFGICQSFTLGLAEQRPGLGGGGRADLSVGRGC